MSDSFDVDATMQFDVENVLRELSATEVLIVQKHREKMIDDIRGQWVGWRYKDRDPITVGRSLDGWRGSEQTQVGEWAILIENKARSWDTGESYVKDVRRHRGAQPEYEIVRENLLQSNIPELIEELTAAIGDDLTAAGPPKRVRKNKNTKYQEIKLEA